MKSFRESIIFDKNTTIKSHHQIRLYAMDRQAFHNLRRDETKITDALIIDTWSSA